MGINQWLWQFGLGKQRLGGLSVAETEELRIAVAKDGGGDPGPKALQGSQGGRAPGGLELDIHRISLIQIFVISISHTYDVLKYCDLNILHI